MRTLVGFCLSLALWIQVSAGSIVFAQEAKTIDPPKGPVASEYVCATVVWACPRKPPVELDVKCLASLSATERDECAKEQLYNAHPNFSCGSTLPTFGYSVRWHECEAYAAPQAGSWKVLCSYRLGNCTSIAFAGTGRCYAEAIRNANCIAHEEARLRGTCVCCREYCFTYEWPCSPCSR
jgi:hypothetical protein